MNSDDLIKSRKASSFVIPAEAGIQLYQMAPARLAFLLGFKFLVLGFKQLI